MSAAARAAVGALLLFSGAHKAGAPVEEFAVVIEAYHLLPEGMLLPAARFLPWVELILGSCLLLGYASRAAAAAAAALFGAFILALLSTLLRGIELSNCGCFGEGLHLEPWQAIALDALLLAAALWSRRGPRGPSLDRWCGEA